MKLAKRRTLESDDFLAVLSWQETLLEVGPSAESKQQSTLYGYGVNKHRFEELPQWAKDTIHMLDMFATDGTQENEIHGIGYKGSFWYEFIGPKYEGDSE